MNFYERALELREETVTHRRWMHRNAEVFGRLAEIEMISEVPTLLPAIRKLGLMRMSVQSVPPVWRTAPFVD